MKTINIKYYILLNLLIYQSAYSQYNEEWVLRNDFGGIDGAQKIIIDNTESFYIIGNGGSQNYDMIILKYSVSRELQWMKIYNGPANSHDLVNASVLDDLNNIYIVGSSTGNQSSDDFTVIKYNQNGDQLWIKRITSSGSHPDIASDVILDSENNLYVTGIIYNDIGGSDCVTIKYDSSGNQIWENRYNRGVDRRNVGIELIIDDSGNVYVTGQSGGDILTLKYNSTGILEWSSIYDGPANFDDIAGEILTDSIGNVYVAGSSIGEYYRDFITIKYNSVGEKQWERRYNGSANFIDGITSMNFDKNENIYVTGRSTETGQGYNITTIKYNSDGDQIWFSSYDNGLNDYAYSSFIDDSGSLFVTGQGDGNGTGFDIISLKLDSSGNQLWVQSYDYSGQYGDYGIYITSDQIGNIYVTGQSNRDFLTIKYSLLTGLNTTLSEIPTQYSLSQNYPNPFNPRTVISYELRVTGNAELKVYDVLGNEVAELVNEKQNAGSHSVEFDGSGFASGIYFYSLLINGNTIDTKRMILLK
ncbi:MAG: T9SS type A sorting domain-containing protein [Bacteroidetes bacterium]|nr:T9SS type A sorting domain-containing protein [Bacteroidota bacterium]